MTELLSGPALAPASGETAKQLIIFLHGLGADGRDLISLAPMFAEVFPDARFVSPNAPFPCDMAPYGYQWFSMLTRNPAEMFAGIRRAEPFLNRFIDHELETLGLEDKDLALIGFSQGCMTALHTSLRRNKPCAAVVGFSGGMLGLEALKDEIVSRPPVCLIHGTFDEVVPFAASEKTEKILKELKVPVEFHPRPGLGHGIDPEGIEFAMDAIGRGFSR